MDTAAADPMRDAWEAMRILSAWEQHPAAAVLDAAQDVPAHLYRALAGRWLLLSPLDRADLCTLALMGDTLARYGPAALKTDGGPRIAPILSESAHFAALAEPGQCPAPSDRARAVTQAAAHLTRYQQLTTQWQTAVLMRLTPPQTTTNRLLSALPEFVPPAPEPDTGTRLETVLSDAEERADAGEDPQVTPPRTIGTMCSLLSKLPVEWQQQVMRRTGVGLNPLQALADVVHAPLRAPKALVRCGGPAIPDITQGADAGGTR
ncbi:hypothetical protein [Streptomyces sp. NPDC002276]